MSQNTDLIKLLKLQPVTLYSAMMKLGIGNFSARKTEVSRMLIGTGKQLKGQWVTLPNGKRVKAWRIVRIDAKA